MNDQELLRYSRHILLNEIGMEGQAKLLAAHALVIGAGGLGSPVVLYLAAAGVGRITLCDNDQVDLSNLQRQIAHPSAALGMNKAESAAQSARAINPMVSITAVKQRAVGDVLHDLVASADVVLDARFQAVGGRVLGGASGRALGGAPYTDQHRQ